VSFPLSIMRKWLSDGCDTFDAQYRVLRFSAE